VADEFMNESVVMLGGRLHCKCVTVTSNGSAAASFTRDGNEKRQRGQRPTEGDGRLDDPEEAAHRAQGRPRATAQPRRPAAASELDRGAVPDGQTGPVAVQILANRSSNGRQQTQGCEPHVAGASDLTSHRQT